MKLLRPLRPLFLYGAALAIATAQTFPSASRINVTTNATGTLTAPSTFWSANAGAISSALSLPNLANATLSGTTVASTITGTSGLALAAGGTGNRDITLTPTAEGEVVIASPTQVGSGRRLRIGGVPVSGTLLTQRGGKAWAITSGGGPFTATSGTYAGQSEIDPVMGWYYNPTSGSPNDDVQWGQSFEARYINAQSGISSEWYLSWQSALHGAGNATYFNRRPVQVNVAHEDTATSADRGRVDWAWSAETFQILGSSNRTATNAGGTFSNDKFFRVLFAGTDHLVETSGSLAANGNLTVGGLFLSQANTGTNTIAADLDIAGSKRLQIGAGTTAPLSLEQSENGKQGLTLYPGGLGQYTRYHTGIDGSGSGNYLDFVGQSSAPSNWLIRQSSNNGTTMVQRGQLSSAGRWIFGSSSDNGVNTVQVGGSVNATTGNTTATGLTTDGTIYLNNAQAATPVLVSGGHIAGNAGIWFGTNASGTPSASNYGIQGSTTTTVVNAPSGGSVLLRIANGTQFTITSSNATFSGGTPVVIPATTASTTTATGALQVAGGAGIGGRTSTSTLNVGGTNGTNVDLLASASATLDFPSIAASGGTQDLTITVTGASVGDVVALGLPAAPSAGVIFNGWVSASNTVTVRATNATAGAIDPASGTYRAAVTSF